MEWIRCEEIGHGSFATVNRAKSKTSSPELPPIIAVKSMEIIASASSSLENEKWVLDRIGVCPQIIRCFGDQITSENNNSVYNLLLEYASNGTLADQAKLSGGTLPEIEVRRHTRSILKGLSVVHAKGFVHCDIKLQNILVFGDGASKIADFGLAKEDKAGNQSRCELRGTPLYLSPESINENVYESPCDVWALGCAVAEMLVGRPVWAHKPGSSVWPLLIRIGGEEEPEIAEEISDEGKDFLRNCFVKDPTQRWTAEMLLNHPFVSEIDDDHLCCVTQPESSSPRCPFEFMDWVSESESSSPAMAQLRKLVSGCEVENDWSFSQSWVTVRDC